MEFVSAVHDVLPQAIPHLELYFGEPVFDRSHLLDSVLDDSRAMSLPSRCILIILIDRFADLLDDKRINRLIELHFLVHSRDHTCHNQLLLREVE